MSTRLLIALILVLAPFAAEASYVWGDGTGGYYGITDRRSCVEVGKTIASFYQATGNGGQGAVWTPLSCSGSVANVGDAFAIGLDEYESGTHTGVQVTAELVAEIQDDDYLDPLAFAGWFAAVFIATLVFYYTVRGAGFVIDVVRKH